MTKPNPPADAGRLLTIDELAARSGVPKSLIYKLKADGLVPFLQRCPNGKLRFPPDALERVTARPAPAGGPLSAAHSTPAEPPRALSGRRPKWRDGGPT